jgi:malonyl-CoA O-methyltransferase
MSLFVAGTDTGVGKTVAAALLLARHGGRAPLVYWKPVATGARDERDRETIATLVPGAATAAETYLFADPVSPHLAARREGVEIELARIGARWRELGTAFPQAEFVVEGAGGLLVPLDERGTLLVDLVAELALPLLLVARSTLGTINHTLLALEALRARRLELAGVALVGPPQPENRQAIERFGGVDVLAEIPPLAELTPAAIAAAAAELDPEDRLARWLAR